jgi:hypothetical protein
MGSSLSHSSRFARCIVYSLATGLITSALVVGQTRRASAESSLRVVVLDQSGAVLPAATVQIKTETGGPREARTNERGEASFNRLKPGEYLIHVEAPGFEPHDIQALAVKQGGNQVEIRLNVAGVKEELAVKESERERSTDPRGNAFSTILTPAQIAELPDDPDEFENALRQMAGPGAPFRVNGFRGGKLPPKSQIREIRFRTNPYSADMHESNFMSVDIFTKPGVDTWHGSIGFGFRDESLNARNAFAPFRGPEQFRRSTFSLDGPIWRNHTSLFLSADGLSAYDSKTIVAALPDGSFTAQSRRPQRMLNLNARAEHALTKTHTLHAEYQRNALRQDNLGVGDFDLFDRAYSSNGVENIMRIADSGALSKRLVNEFRFQARWDSTDRNSTSNEPATLVLNAFNSGGAGLAGGRETREFEIADNLDFVVGKHSMRTGLLIEQGHYNSDEFNNSNGTFTFASLDDFRAGRPTTFTQRIGDPLVGYSQFQMGWYFLDDYRIRKNLSLSLGVRHEFQTHVSDSNNFAPRIAVSWSPFKDGKTTFRAGGGIFYDWYAASAFEQTLRVDGIRQQDLVIQNPGFPNPLTGGTQLLLPPSRIVGSKDLVMPYVEQFSLGMQRQLGKFSFLMVNYSRQRGVHQLRGHNINAPLADGIRPDPDSGNVNQIESTANSTTQALMVNLNFVNPEKHYFFAANYVLSKAINESDGPLSLPANNFDLFAERGPAPGDSRHRLFAIGNFSLPWHFRMSGIFHVRSSLPYNITTGFDDNHDTVSNDRPTGVGRNSARGAAEWDLSTRLGWGFGFGKPGERSGGPVVKTVKINNRDDALGGLGSNGDVNKRYKVDFYVQAFNIFNHVNLTNFSGVETSPFFGRATAALQGRRIESGVRFSF